MDTHKELYNKIFNLLPHKWEMVTLNLFNKLQAYQPLNIDSADGVSMYVAGLENMNKLISILSDIPVNEIEELPQKYLYVLSDKLKFLNEPVPDAKHCNIKFKALDKLSGAEFIELNKGFENSDANLMMIVKAVIEDKTVDVGALPITEVLAGFFLLKKHYSKLVTRSLLSLHLRLIWQLIREKIERLF